MALLPLPHDEHQVGPGARAADPNELVSERCIYEGNVAGLYSYIAGIVTIPVLITKMRHQPPMKIEYKFLIAGLSSLAISYFATRVGQHLCTNKRSKELQKLSL